MLSDINADGRPDVLIGDRTRSLEIFAWPLVPLPEGEELTLAARLKRQDQPGGWRTDAENRFSSSVPNPEKSGNR